MNSGLTGAQAQNQPQMVLDRNDPRRDWGPSALNPASQASISGRYELPFGHGKRWLKGASGVENKLIGGWQLNGIATLLSGFPFTPVIGTNRSGDGDTRNPDRPSWNPAFTGPVVLGQSRPVVQSECVRSARGAAPTEIWGAACLPVRDWRIWTCRCSRTRQSPNGQACSSARSSSTSSIMRILARPTRLSFSSGAVNASAGLITTLATTPRQIQFGMKLMF